VSRETLAERSGLDHELIRRIEEEGFIPELAPLIRISRALGVRLGTLLDDREELGPVVTRAGKARDAARFYTGIPTDKNGVALGGAQPRGPEEGLAFKTLASDKSGRHMEPFLINVSHEADQEKSTHEGEEFIYVLEGQLAVDYGKDHYDLAVGDSIYYDSIVPHRVAAGEGAGSTRILAVVYTPV
jgi:mannose-6-phosphate isomerase-like protein (cupin superfamily)